MKGAIKGFVNPYRGESIIIYCIDCDDYDSKPEDMTFFNAVKQYCADQGYELVWFCKDIESVYLGSKIPKSRKKAESVSFRSKGQIRRVNRYKLLSTELSPNTSNIMRILDKYLTRKERGSAA